MAEKHDTVRGLVLAGGGAKGSYQVGVYQALMELGWLPDVITGASVGSLNAALFVMGKVNEAADLWRSLDTTACWNCQRAKRRRNCVISCWKLCAAAG